MNRSRTEHGACDSGEGTEGGGLSSFLRSLLSGIPWSESASEEIHVELTVPRGGLVDIYNARGRTRIIGEDRNDVELVAVKNARAESQRAARALLDEIRIDANVSGDVLEVEVEVPRKWNRHGSTDLELHVPRELRVNVTSSNGRLCVQGLRCSVKAHSSNGSVSIVDVVGDIDVTTANAKVCCAHTCGRLIARSSNGKIDLGEHRGSVDAATSNGLIHASLEELAREGVTLATSNGRIVLELPEDPDADVDIRVDNGLIRNELELGPDTRSGSGRLRGRAGRGGTPIKLRTSNGTVSLRQARAD